MALVLTVFVLVQPVLQEALVQNALKGTEAKRAIFALLAITRQEMEVAKNHVIQDPFRG
jgi:hypothetical protein